LEVAIRCLWLGAVCGMVSLHAQTILAPRFLAQTWKVVAGDAVEFRYVESADSPKLSQIRTWSWDFDGDGVVDLKGAPTTNGVVEWVSRYDPARAASSNQVWVLPVLQLTLTNTPAVVLSRTGITERTTLRLTPADADQYLIVVPGTTSDGLIQVAVSASPRLARVGTPVRFAADIRFVSPRQGRVKSVKWNFGDGTPVQEGANPSHPYADPSSYDIEVKVEYELLTLDGQRYEATATNAVPLRDAVRVVNSGGNLSLGRSYRRGFPAEYGWEDIIRAYATSDASGNAYRYYQALGDALSDAYPGARSGNGLKRVELAEALNEILQGQSLVANQRLIEALRVKYPRLTDAEAANPPPRLPQPPGARTETQAIDVSLLDFQAALQPVFQAIQEFGTPLLRSRAEPGREPFPQFPSYLAIADPDLSPQSVPIRNEYWQLTSVLDRLAFGGVEKAKKLFNLSVADATAREESKETCKRAALTGYLGMAVLAAAQDTNDFVMNQGNSLLANVQNARDLFEGINGGLNPIRNNGEFVPNSSFASTLGAARRAVDDARSSEIEFRSEKREFDRRKAELRSELQSQRAQFITPLKNLTGIDPAQYNNLANVADQRDYRRVVDGEIQRLIDGYPNVSAAGKGEYGSQVIAILDAAEAVRQSINRLGNLTEANAIARWANAEIDFKNDTARKKLRANDISRGRANAVSFSAGASFPGGWQVGVSVSPGSVISGYLNADDRDIQTTQQAEVSDIQLEAEIKKAMLEEGNLIIDIRRAKNAMDQQRLRLEAMVAQRDRLIEDLANARLTAENLYFQDPSFRVVVSSAQRRADGELDFAVDRLFRLAKTLEYEWTEKYQNPVRIPVGSDEPPALENPLFDKFTDLESLFTVRTADESKDYLDALEAWDSKLRRITVTSVRGPNHAGPVTADPISVRETILGLKTTGPGAMTMAQSVAAFRDYIRANRITNIFNPSNPSLQFPFATSIEDNSMFPATGSRWNMRIATIQVDLLADTGFNTRQVAEVDLLESGLARLRTYWADPPLDDAFFYRTFNLGSRAERSAYGIVVPARINGATAGRPPSEFTVAGLAGRPIAASQWVLKIDTANPVNRDVNFDRLKDIVIRFTYTYGNPPELFSGF
jgi:hypothetical protein